MEGDFPTYVRQFARNCGTEYKCPFGNCGSSFLTEDAMTRHLRTIEVAGGHKSELRHQYNNLSEILIRARGIEPATSCSVGESIENPEDSGDSVGMSEGDYPPCSSAHGKRKAIGMELVWPTGQGFKRSRYSKNVVKEPIPKLPEPIESLSSCAACKTLGQQCADKCVLAPYFPPTELHKFTTVDKVFGASNIIKFLQKLPVSLRADAVESMVYEANARIRDPVYGCVGAICHLQNQVGELQAHLAKAQAEVVSMQCQQANLMALICMEMAEPKESSM